MFFNIHAFLTNLFVGFLSKSLLLAFNGSPRRVSWVAVVNFSGNVCVLFFVIRTLFLIAPPTAFILQTESLVCVGILIVAPLIVVASFAVAVIVEVKFSGAADFSEKAFSRQRQFFAALDNFVGVSRHNFTFFIRSMALISADFVASADVPGEKYLFMNVGDLFCKFIALKVGHDAHNDEEDDKTGIKDYCKSRNFAITVFFFVGIESYLK
uniref:Uncharacterized protein n=1 Tax=Romanomermis culicivorax TaxID=13658 RepID=A0A915JX66_ROMCU